MLNPKRRQRLAKKVVARKQRRNPLQKAEAVVDPRQPLPGGSNQGKNQWPVFGKRSEMLLKQPSRGWLSTQASWRTGMLKQIFRGLSLYQNDVLHCFYRMCVCVCHGLFFLLMMVILSILNNIYIYHKKWSAYCWIDDHPLPCVNGWKLDLSTCRTPFGNFVKINGMTFALLATLRFTPARHWLWLRSFWKSQMFRVSWTKHLVQFIFLFVQELGVCTSLGKGLCATR